MAISTESDVPRGLFDDLGRVMSAGPRPMWVRVQSTSEEEDALEHALRSARALSGLLDNHGVSTRAPLSIHLRVAQAQILGACDELEIALEAHRYSGRIHRRDGAPAQRSTSHQSEPSCTRNHDDESHTPSREAATYDQRTVRAR